MTTTDSKHYRFLDKRFRPSSIHGPVTKEFLAEVQQFNLHFLCEQCAFFDDEREICIHNYPTAPHRQKYFEDNDEKKTLIFCREFEPI